MYTHFEGRGKPPAAAQGNRVPLFVPGRDFPVAFFEGGVLSKGMRANHFLQKPAGAIAFDEAVLNEARALGTRRIEVRDLERGTLYSCSWEDFDRYRVFLDRGFGRQWALEPGRWSINGAPAVVTAREAAQAAAQAAKGAQLSLFEAVAA